MQSCRRGVFSRAAIQTGSSHKTLGMVSTTDRTTHVVTSGPYTCGRSPVTVRIRSYYAYKLRTQEDSYR